MKTIQSDVESKQSRNNKNIYEANGYVIQDTKLMSSLKHATQINIFEKAPSIQLYQTQ